MMGGTYRDGSQWKAPQGTDTSRLEFDKWAREEGLPQADIAAAWRGWQAAIGGCMLPVGASVTPDWLKQAPL